MKKFIPTFEADVVKGKLKIGKSVRQAMARWVSTFKNGTHLEIIIRKFRSKRTLEQNAYYWGVVVNILADHFGYETEEMHEELKRLFNPIESKITPGVMIGGSTTKLSTEEFYCGETSYVERICRWAATEHGVYIPPPKKIES